MTKWFMSSTGTGDLSLTIKGLLLALVPLSVTTFQHFGVELAQEDIVEVVNQLFAAISAVMILVGLIRKFANRKSE
jgi:hypothetical protein